MSKYLIYLRKSRADNPLESVEEVLARHEAILKDFCTKYFGGAINDIYREVVSGETINERPLMLQLLNDVEKGEISGVIVVEPQRLSRGSFADIDRIVNTFRYTNTKIITPTKTYDLNDKYDRKSFEQELLRGNDYLEYVKEILVRGRIRSVEDGYYIGSITPYGYDKMQVQKKRFILVPNAEADNVKYIFEQFIGGLGTTNLAKHLIEIGMKSKTGKQWTPAMVRNILIHRVYIGYVNYGRRATKVTMQNGELVKSCPVSKDYIEARGLHEPIISQETFEKAQELLKSTPAKNIRGDKSVKNPLAGLVKCKQCGSNMFRRPYRTERQDGLICAKIGCKNVASDLIDVERRVIDLLEKELANYKYYVDNYEKEYKTNALTYEKQLKKIDNDLIALQKDLQNALINFNRRLITEQEYTFLRTYTLDEENRLKGQKNAIESKMQIEELDNRRKAIPILEMCIKNYYTLSIEDKHALLTSIIEKIIYDKTARGGRWNTEDKSSFTLELFLKV